MWANSQPAGLHPVHQHIGVKWFCVQRIWCCFAIESFIAWETFHTSTCIWTDHSSAAPSWPVSVEILTTADVFHNRPVKCLCVFRFTHKYPEYLGSYFLTLEFWSYAPALGIYPRYSMLKCNIFRPLNAPLEVFPPAGKARLVCYEEKLLGRENVKWPARGGLNPIKILLLLFSLYIKQRRALGFNCDGDFCLDLLVATWVSICHSAFRYGLGRIYLASNLI